MDDIFLLFILMALSWYIWDSLSTKELAKTKGQQVCKNSDVQLLDDTVRLHKLWLRRNNRGQLQICRIYLFEFTSTGEFRYSGLIVMIGKHIEEVKMDAFHLS
ncbi:MAG: DUF3301 domain-containing protein [Methylococcales bacterium]|jgi:hypothetical protein|nr:DUF3301 domain-containing protein [Methylococcales bacterium]MBT7411172.1 DUF3301 domain-containing protein [Methylococcales bacterium]